MLLFYNNNDLSSPIPSMPVNIDYYITFGELEGYVRDEDGNKYELTGMLGMGEDKSLLL